jgi:hypothetical protein
VPVRVNRLTVKVSVLVVVVGFGRNAAVTPVGMPEAVNLTLPANPLDGITVIVLVPRVPWVTVRLTGDAVSAKFCGTAGFTVSETVVCFVRLPETPVIVMFAVP